MMRYKKAIIFFFLLSCIGLPMVHQSHLSKPPKTQKQIVPLAVKVSNPILYITKGAEILSFALLLTSIIYRKTSTSSAASIKEGSHKPPCPASSGQHNANSDAPSHGDPESENQHE
ncbi:MAG: hypothetical protein ACPGC9_01170 [Cytophagales bacterium]